MNELLPIIPSRKAIAMRLLYTLAWLLLLPFAFAYLLWRARRQPGYRGHWRERLGWAPAPDGRPVIWIHAVSVGETRAAAPLVRALLDAHPECGLLLTHATPTGRATGAELFAGRVRQAYLPYDLPWLCTLFRARARPQLGVFLETEIWPNLYAACQAKRVPIFLVNARLSARSAAGYARFPGLVRNALARLAGVAAQTDADARRLADLGAAGVITAGNLKFDLAPPADAEARAADLRALWGARFVWLAASTREGEEALILDALDALDLPDLLLVLVPRHPQRFDQVARLVAQRGHACVRRGEARPVPAATRVFLGDSMGELAAYYAASDVAFVGGSLLPLGGQNLIEALAAARPVLIGPHTFNFAQASELAVAAGAARRVADSAELAAAVGALHDQPEVRRAMGAAGLAFTRAHRGATDRVLALLAPALGGKPTGPQPALASRSRPAP